MKKLLVLLFITTFCFSQEKELTVSQIDSICSINQSKSEARELIKEKKITIGAFEIVTYNYNNKIIKIQYFEEINKNNLNHLFVFQYYYFLNNPFLLKINITEKEKNKNSKELNISLNKDEIEDYKEIKNELMINLRKKIITINSKVQKYIDANSK